jgi:hypothetical protein
MHAYPRIRIRIDARISTHFITWVSTTWGIVLGSYTSTVSYRIVSYT